MGERKPNGLTLVIRESILAGNGELTIRVEQVERGLEREIDERKLGDKYAHRMIEDVKTSHQEIALTFSRIEAAFKQHLEDDKAMVREMTDTNLRLRTVEKLVWSAIGGLVIIGSGITIGVAVILHYLK